MSYAINAAKKIVSISLQEGKGLLTLTVCDKGLGEVTQKSCTEVQKLIPDLIWQEFDGDVTFDFELQLVLTLTYDYVDPNEYHDGESHDTGFLIKGNIDFSEYFHTDIQYPLGLTPFSGKLNDLTKCDPDLTLDFYDLQKLAQCTLIHDEVGHYANLTTLIEYLCNPNIHGWYTANYGDSITLGIHHV